MSDSSRLPDQLPDEREAMVAVIVANSLAKAATDNADWICTEDGDMHWFARTWSRSRAIGEFLASTDPTARAKDVRCTAVWMWINPSQIEDHARAWVGEDGDWIEDIEHAVAYTWEGDSFAYTECKRTDEGARPFWRCAWKDW